MSSSIQKLILGILTHDIDLVKKSIEEGADVNADYPDHPSAHCSVFTLAVEKGNLDIIQYMIISGANLNSSTLISAIKTREVYLGTSLIKTNSSLEVVKLLVENHADVNEKDSSGKTPLNEAIILNKEDIVNYLLSRGADVNQTDGSRRLPISLAVVNNQVEIVKTLVMGGADINLQDSQGNSARTLAQRLSDKRIDGYFDYITSSGIRYPINLVWNYQQVEPIPAVVENAEEVAEDFVVVKNPPKHQSVPKDKNPKEDRDEDGWTSLAKAIRQEKIDNKSASKDKNPKQDQDENGWTSLAKAIRQEKIDNKSASKDKNPKEDQDENGGTPLAKAIRQEKIDNKSASKDKNPKEDQDENGWTPLAKAIRDENPDNARILLEEGAKPYQISKGMTPLQLAVKVQNLEIIRLLLENGAEVNIYTALFEAIALSNVEVVACLLEKQVDLNFIYKNLYTPLTKSVEMENLDIVKELVKKGANVNMSDGKETSPLGLSMQIGNSEIVSYLHTKGASLPKNETYQFLEKSISDGDIKILKILVEILKINIDIFFDSGYSPLTKAVELGNLEIVKLLVGSTDIVNKPDGNEKYPLSIAAASQDLPLVKFFIDCGADTNFAKKEIVEFADVCEDFAIYWDIKKGKYAEWKQGC